MEPRQVTSSSPQAENSCPTRLPTTTYLTSNTQLEFPLLHAYMEHFCFTQQEKNLQTSDDLFGSSGKK